MNKKYQELLEYLKGLESVLIAFSGGVDSTFLLKAAKDALGKKVKAVTVSSPYIPRWEIEEAKEFVKEIGVKHEILELGLSDIIIYNPEDRCYLCKKFIFSNIKSLAEKEGYSYVLDGTNVDDLGDYRPGLKALKELEIVSPLVETEFRKQDIRDLSNELKLPTWDKPPYACLLTRIPYGEELKESDFRIIEEAEKYMMSIGFRAVRVRKHGDLARIEIDKKDRSKLFNEELLDEISMNIKKAGFKYVSLDMEGYKMGSFNSGVRNESR